MKPLIKICGISNLEDALSATQLNVWALGFVFTDSPRRIAETGAKEIAGKLPPYVAKVGLFVNEDIDNIKRIVGSCKLDMVQLHGEETPQFCESIKGFTKVIKAFRIKDEESLKKIPSYNNVDLYLLDTYAYEVYGGTGKTFNWDLAIKAKEYGKNIILAGGLNPRNILEAIKVVEPYAVDISSGIERVPGRKDKKLMNELVSKIKTL